MRNSTIFKELYFPGSLDLFSQLQTDYGLRYNLCTKAHPLFKMCGQEKSAHAFCTNKIMPILRVTKTPKMWVI